MKILILGAKGMLGQDLVRVFRSDEDYDVRAWDREEIDISDRAQVEQKISKAKPDIIINAAAYNAVDKCEGSADFEIAKKINGFGVGYLAKIAKNINSLIVHYSTDYVFDGEKREGYQEDDLPNPVSQYGQSKLLGEQELLKNTNQYYLIRTSCLFGSSAAAGQGKKSFFETILNLAKERDKLELVDEELSCFTYTTDLAQASKKLIEQKPDFGIYHLVNSVPATWYEGALELFKQADLKIAAYPVSADKFPRPAKRPKFSILLNTKLPSLRSYKKALREFLSNF